MALVFLVFPAMIGILGLASGMAFSLIGGLEALYYLAAFGLTIVAAFGWLDRVLSR